MELSGHPTYDLVEELIDRGAVAVPGGPDGPDPAALAVVPIEEGSWLWLPAVAYETGVD
jgi:hypothetical protein